MFQAVRPLIGKFDQDGRSSNPGIADWKGRP